MNNALLQSQKPMENAVIGLQEENEAVLRAIAELKNFGPYLELKRLIFDKEQGVVERRLEREISELVSGNLNPVLRDQGILEGMRKLDLDTIEERFKVERKGIIERIKHINTNGKERNQF